jgi:hypothetical protein
MVSLTSIVVVFPVTVPWVHLVLWIEVFEKSLPGLLHHMNDTFSCGPEEDLEYYASYDKADWIFEVIR